MHDAENKSSHRRTQRAFVEGEADHMTTRTLPPPLPQMLTWTFKLQIKSAAQKCFWSLHFASFCLADALQNNKLFPNKQLGRLWSNLQSRANPHATAVFSAGCLTSLQAALVHKPQAGATTSESSNWSCNRINNNFTSFYHQATIILNHILPSGDLFHPQIN